MLAIKGVGQRVKGPALAPCLQRRLLRQLAEGLPRTLAMTLLQRTQVARAVDDLARLIDHRIVGAQMRRQQFFTKRIGWHNHAACALQRCGQLHFE